MGIPVVIYGKSGSGKSRSLKNFEETEICLINVEGKSLPFRHTFKYTMKADDVNVILAAIKRLPADVKTIVIDDAGYIMTHYFMKNHRNMKGNAQFDMYNQMADDMCALINGIKELPEDRIVYLMYHEETSDYGDTKLLTIGKLLDQKAPLIGMVTIALRCMSTGGRHFFRTVTDGSDITKAPEEMFTAEEIENDLKAVDSAIREYYNIPVIAKNATAETKTKKKEKEGKTT
jgi:hypothetical protein